MGKSQQLRDILTDYAEPKRATVVAKFPRPESTHGPVRIIRYDGQRMRGGKFDVWVGEERIYACVNTEWSSRWLAANFAPAARPA